MTLVVHALGAYAAYTHTKWRNEDFTVRNLVKAIKGEAFNGYSNVTGADGVNRYFDAKDRQPALDTFSVWAAAQLATLELGDVRLVAVPSSTQVAFRQDTAPVRMARALAQKHAAGRVGHWLRFTQAKQAAHAGGVRNQAILEAALDLDLTNLDVALPIVLVDDVKTTGAHLKACATVLRGRGATVEHVFVAGSTVWDQHPTPLAVPPEDIEASPFDDLL